MGDNMVQTKYDFPLPNDGERYNLSQDELIKILDHVYDCGYENARDRYDPERQGTLTWASSEDRDDNSKWYVYGGK